MKPASTTRCTHLIIDTTGAVAVAIMGYAHMKTGRYSFIRHNPKLFGKRRGKNAKTADSDRPLIIQLGQPASEKFRICFNTHPAGDPPIPRCRLAKHLASQRQGT